MNNLRFNIIASRWGFGVALIAVVMLFALPFAVAQEDKGATVVRDDAPKVSGSIDVDSVSIGDRFVYSIEVDKDLVQSVLFPSFTGAGSEAYELIEDMPVDTLSREGRRLKIRKSYRLAAFEEGIHNVVPQVMYADKNIVDTLYGPDTLSLLVTTFQIDSTSHAPFDIKPQKNLPFKFGEISGYVKWTVIVLIILLLLLYALKRILAHFGKNISDIFKPAPPVPPHVEAQMALEKLRQQRLWQEGEHKLYYSTLTDILRAYIAGRYGVGAMEMTSDEIIEAMRDVELPQKSAMDLSDILRVADLVKFAKAMPEADENEAAFRAAWDFVEQTKPVEIVEDDEDEPKRGGKN